jgi:serine/threonine-protein kinase RsbW
VAGAVVELEFPARAEFVALARVVVSALASRNARLADERIDDLKIAVSEACTNAIEAHGAIATSERVLVRCRTEPDRFEVHIHDRGEGFDPSALPHQVPLNDPGRLRFERGLGIPLIRALVDEVEFSSSERGTAVRMVMWHPSAQADGEP